MKYVLELEMATLHKVLDYKKGDAANMDTKPSTSSQVTTPTLTTIAQAYKDKLEESVGNKTRATVKETYDFVGDITKMVKHLSNEELANKDIMNNFMTKVTVG